MTLFKQSKMTFKINKNIIFSNKNKLMINKKYKFKIKTRI